MEADWTRLTSEEEKELLACADQSRMYLCPSDILGKYCALDAEATWLLHTHILEPVAAKFLAYQEYFSSAFMCLERLLIVQGLAGITINLEKLQNYSEALRVGGLAARTAFLQYSTVAQAVKQLHADRLKDFEETKPVKTHKLQKAPGKEPSKKNKDGSVSKHWLAWEAKKDAPPEMTAQYQKWLSKRAQIVEAQEKYTTEEYDSETIKKLNLLNMDSPLQKAALFYNYLGFPVEVWTTPEDSTAPAQPSTCADALRGFGEVGKLFQKYADLTKLHQMVNQALELAVSYPDNVWKIHPQFKVPGTLTGRLGGSGGINLQNIPVDEGYLSSFTASKGCVLLESDAAALEPHVMAQLSGDTSMWKLYGPGAKQNDVYLFVGAAFPGIGNKFRAAGYDPNNPTPETISYCKKEFKADRQVCKIAHLSAAYGCGPGKWKQSFALEGHNYSFDKCKQMHMAYWDLFKGIKEWEKKLQGQWEKNKGWILNGIGRPVGVDKVKLKDLCNVAVQSAGHDILLFTLDFLQRRLMEANVPFRPWMVDMHDEYFFEVREEDKEKALEIAIRVEEELNHMLNSDIRIKFGPQILHNWYQAKAE